MSVNFRTCIPLGFVAWSLFTTPALRAAEEPAGDLTPVLPSTRALVNNGNPYQFRNFNPGSSQSLSADGKLLLMTGNGLMLWKLGEGNSGQPLTIDTSSVQINMWNAAAALSTDGKIAAVVPQNYGGDIAVRFFDTATGKQIREIDNDQPILGLAFSPDGRRLAVGTQQRLELWKADDGEEIRIFSGAGAQNVNYRRLAFSPDGKMIAALGNEPDTVHIWEVASGKERAAVHFGAQSASQPAGGRLRKMRVGFPGNNMNNAILALSFSADGRILAVSKQDLSIHLWDLQADRELPTLTGSRGQVTALGFTADGKELIGVDTEGTRLSWRMASLRRNCNVRLTPLSDADFAELWNDLAEPDMFRAYRARRHLVADAKRAVPMLDRYLEAVPSGDAARIQRLVKDLSSANAGTRRKAMTELRSKHGEAALGALRELNGIGNAAGPGIPAGAVMMKGGGGNGQAVMVLLQKLQMKYDTPQRRRDVLAVRILQEIGTPDAKQTLRKLSKGAAGVELTTASKAALDHLTAAAKERPRSATPEQLWSDLGSDDAMRAFKAMGRLTAAPEQAAALLGKELKPIPVVENEQIAALVNDLNSDEFKIRENATQALAKISEQALPAMKKALSDDIALEARKRLEQLVEQASSQTSISLVRVLRGVEVLERTGTADAKRVLETLSGGAPQAVVTREAKASLQRLARQ